MKSSLSQRVFMGFIRLQLVLAILLFLPAGSVRFWEAWLYWGLFGGSVLFCSSHDIFSKWIPALWNGGCR